MGSDADSTAAAIAARRSRTARLLAQVEKAISQLAKEQRRVTVTAIAARSGASTSFLYQNPDARRLVSDACSAAATRRDQAAAREHERVEAQWRERALNAEDGLKTAQKEIIAQRRRIGELMGQIRDADQAIDGESVQRLVSENLSLKQQVSQLTRERQALAERLEAARSNLRFADKRVADLEVQLTEGQTYVS